MLWRCTHEKTMNDTLQEQGIAAPADTALHAENAQVEAKLDALLWFLNVEDHPDARILLQGCRADIARLWR